MDTYKTLHRGQNLQIRANPKSVGQALRAREVRLNDRERRDNEDGTVSVVDTRHNEYLSERTIRRYLTGKVDKDGKPIIQEVLHETLHRAYKKVRGKKARRAEKKARRIARER